MCACESVDVNVYALHTHTHTHTHTYTHTHTHTNTNTHSHRRWIDVVSKCDLAPVKLTPDLLPMVFSFFFNLFLPSIFDHYSRFLVTHGILSFSPLLIYSGIHGQSRAAKAFISSDVSTVYSVFAPRSCQ
jgi:hypothetical protein